MCGRGGGRGRGVGGGGVQKVPILSERTLMVVVSDCQELIVELTSDNFVS